MYSYLWDTTLGDVSIRGLFDLLDMDGYQLSLTLGATVPTRSISKMGLTASGVQGVLPYTMQAGSGSPDILAGGTFQVQNEVASMGAQINSVIHIMHNNRRYRLGDAYDITVWGAYNVTDWVSFSLRGLFEQVKSRVVCKSERKLLDASVRLPWRPPSVREA